jgi:hypothetical protein
MIYIAIFTALTGNLFHIPVSLVKKLSAPFLIIFGLFVILMAQSCAPSRVVRPLAENEKRFSGSLGGPLIRYGNAVTPTPFLSFTYAQGLSDSVTVFAAVNATSMAFNNVQTEIGGTYLISKNDSNTVGISGTFQLNTAFNINDPIKKKFLTDSRPDVNSFRIWPQIDINRYWVFNKPRDRYLYYGASVWFDFKTRMQSGQKQNTFVFISPHVGTKLTNKLYDFTFELKYLVPYLNSWAPAVDYIRPVGRYGGLGLHLTISKKLIKREYIEEEVQE